MRHPRITLSLLKLLAPSIMSLANHVRPETSFENSLLTTYVAMTNEMASPALLPAVWDHLGALCVRISMSHAWGTKQDQAIAHLALCISMLVGHLQEPLDRFDSEFYHKQIDMILRSRDSLEVFRDRSCILPPVADASF